MLFGEQERRDWIILRLTDKGAETAYHDARVCKRAVQTRQMPSQNRRLKIGMCIAYCLVRCGLELGTRCRIDSFYA